MTIWARESEEFDEQLHHILFGDDPDAGPAPPYSTDRVAIRKAIEQAFPRVELGWEDADPEDWNPRPVLLVLNGGRQLFWHIVKDSQALCLCEAAIKLMALTAPVRPVREAETGFYWFRPHPGVHFFPTRHFTSPATRRGGQEEVILDHPFAFSVSEPFPVFIRRRRGEPQATGVSFTIEWPENDGAIEVPLRRLPGELGPRIEPPDDWHADYEPEQLIELPDGGEELDEDDVLFDEMTAAVMGRRRNGEE